MMRTPLPLLVALAMLAVALAGCLPPPAPPPEDLNPPKDNACTPYTRPPAATGASLSGQNAFGFMLRLVCDFSAKDPKPLYRIPGTAGQTKASLYLHSTLSSFGWNTTWQNFTGADYQQMDKLGAGAWANACGKEAKERLPHLPFSNVVAMRGGTSNSILLLIAHYDSKRTASQDRDPARTTDPVLGANDGASGVGVLLELARVWSTKTLPFEIRILFTDGEDGFEDCHPLAGAVAYANALTQSERSRFEGVLLLDMVGNASSPFMLHGNTETMPQKFKLAAQAEGVEPLAKATVGGSVVDDHTPFMSLGLPAMDVIPSDYYRTDYWHTTHDVPSKLSASFMGDVARTVDRFVALLPSD
jgi:hypothetical protein